MADSKIQIAVEVVGGKEAQEELKKIERATTSISGEAKKSGKQVAAIGESFKQVGNQVESNKKTTQGVQSLSRGLGDANEGAVTLGRAMVTLADNGSRGMIAILGPIGAVIATIYTLYEGYQEITGAAKEYEKTSAVAAAVASDLTSKLDNLASKAIRLTSDEMRDMIKSIFDARMGIEYMNEQIAESQKIFSDRIQAQRELNIILGKEKDLIDQNMWFFSRWTASVVKGIAIFTDFRTQQEKLADAQEALNKVTKEQEEYVRELTKAYEEKYEASIKEEQAQIRRETTLSEALDMLEAEYTAQMELNILMIEAYGPGSPQEKAIQIKRLQVSASEELAKASKKDRLAIYDEAQSLKELNLQNKVNLEASAKAVKQKNELTELEKKALDDKTKNEVKNTNTVIGLSKLRTSSYQNEFQERKKIFDREIELLNREKESLSDLSSLKARIYQQEKEFRSVQALTQFEMVKKAISQGQLNYKEIMEASRELVNTFNFIVDKETEVEKKLLEKKRDFDLKNIKQSGLTQQQIEEDYQYHLNKLLSMSKYKAAQELADGYKNLTEEFINFNNQRNDIKKSTEDSSNEIADIKKSIQLRELSDYENTEYNRINIIKKSNDYELQILKERYEQSKEDFENRKKLYDHEVRQKIEHEKFLETLGIQTRNANMEMEDYKAQEILNKKQQQFEAEKKLLDENYNYQKSLLEKNLADNSQYNIDKLAYDLKYSEEHESYLTRMFLSEEQIRDKANNIILEKQRQRDLELIENEKKARQDKVNQGIKAIEDSIKQSEERIADYYL